MMWKCNYFWLFPLFYWWLYIIIFSCCYCYYFKCNSFCYIIPTFFLLLLLFVVSSLFWPLYYWYAHSSIHSSIHQSNASKRSCVLVGSYFTDAILYDRLHKDQPPQPSNSNVWPNAKHRFWIIFRFQWSLKTIKIDWRRI